MNIIKIQGEKFTCNICGKEIIGKHRYKVHISRHPKSLKYVPCGECGEVSYPDRYWIMILYTERMKERQIDIEKNIDRNI